MFLFYSILFCFYSIPQLQTPATSHDTLQCLCQNDTFVPSHHDQVYPANYFLVSAHKQGI